MSLPLGGKTGLTDIHSNFFCAYLIYHIFLMHCLNDITPIALVSICFIPKTSVKIEILAFLYLVHDCNDHCLYHKLPIFLLKNSTMDATVAKCQDVRNNVYFWHQIQTELNIGLQLNKIMTNFQEKQCFSAQSINLHPVLGVSIF